MRTRTALISVVLVALLASPVFSAVVITEVAIPTANSLPGLMSPRSITAGPDGNLWFTEAAFNSNKIGKITPAGVITEFPLPPSGALRRLGDITAGPDGNLWFTEVVGNKIGRLNLLTGIITEFPLSDPFGITAGPDGNLWFTDRVGNKIGQLDPSTGAVMKEFPIPTPFSEPGGITVGPDGNLWFTETGGNKIGRLNPTNPTTTTGAIQEFTIPTFGSMAFGITAGPDGNVWFTEQGGDKIGKITPAGVITEFPLTTGSMPWGITAGPDGNLWFAEANSNNIGRITPAGVVTEFAIPTASSAPSGITTGPDGNLWFTEIVGNIGKLVPPPSSPAALIRDLVTLVNSFNLPAGIQNSLDAKLERALASVNRGGLTSACNQVGAFMNEVNAQSGKALMAPQPDRLLEKANAIRATLGCQ